MYSGQAFLGLGHPGHPPHGHHQQQPSPLSRSASVSHPTPFPMAYSVATSLHPLSPFRQHSPGRSAHQSRSSSPGGHLVSAATFPTMDSFSAQLRTGFDPLHSLSYRFPYTPASTPMDIYASAFRPIASLSALWSPGVAVPPPQQQHAIQRPSALTSSMLQSGRGGVAPASASAGRTPLPTLERPTKAQSTARSDPASSSSSDSLVQTLKTFLLPQRSTAPSERSSSAASDGGQLDKASGSRSGAASDSHNQAAFDGTTVLCQVCGDKASGFHYGVHACEGCKGFFRRSIQQKIQYRPCTKNQQCSILRINRNRCQYCRLKKCIAVGMSRDAVRFGRVPKREKAKILEEMQRASVKCHMDSLTAELEDDDRLVTAVVTAHLHTCDLTRNKLGPLLEHYRRLGANQPASCVACPLNPRPVSPAVGQCDDMSERYLPAMKGVVDFAKSIPGFQILSQEDRVTLLKAGMFEVLLLRLAVLFDSETKSFMLLDGTVFRRDANHFVPGHGASSHGRFLVDSLFDFIERFNALGLTDADIALYCSVVLFSPDRPGLRNQELVEKMNERLKCALRKVIALHHPTQPAFYDHLMMKVADLRTLNTLHQEKLLSFKSDGSRLDRAAFEKANSEAASSRTRSPSSERNSQILPASSNDINREEATSHWSTACKASEGTPSTSPMSATAKSLETANRLRQLGLSPSGDGPKCPRSSQAHHYPAREASSFDSGKGTLSNKASSSSDSDSDDGRCPHRHRSSNGVLLMAQPAPAIHKVADMPALKRALQAPSKAATPPSSNSHISPPSHHTASIRDRHRAVASLLERPSGLLSPSTSAVAALRIADPAPPQHSKGADEVDATKPIWQTLLQPQHSATLLLASRALTTPVEAHQRSRHVPMAAHTNHLSPKRSYPFDNCDEQPLNLSKRPNNRQ